jgi:sugar O-acyltransferase (sialic acid O-acetyltransferase NeuD family)
VSEARVIIVGCGGHARVLMDALSLQGVAVAGLTDADATRHGQRISGFEVLGDDSVLERFAPQSTVLVNGIGSTASMDGRKAVFERLKARGYRFFTVVHPSAVLAQDVVLEEGAQVMAGAVIQTGASVGRNSIVNTGARVDHDCRVGAHVHLAPGVVLSGDVEIGEGSHVGTRAAIVQGIRVGAGCLVAAGAVVVKDVAAGARVAGVPAKDLRR